MAYMFTGWELVLVVDLIFLVLFSVRFYTSRVRAYLYLVLSTVRTSPTEILTVYSDHCCRFP
jgi:hypothetical protein